MNQLRLLALTLAIFGLALGPLSAAEDRPNILMILVDDLKPAFGAYGQEWVHSPNLDQLAGRGMLFNAAYCNQAVCAASRNNLLVGARSTSLGIYNLATNFRVAEPDAVPLPQYFRRHGYHAAGIGKVYHIGHGNTDDPESWSVPFHPDKVIDYVLPESTGGELTREEAYFSNQKLGQIGSLPRGAAWERADVEDEAYADGRIAAEGIRRLRRAKETEEPFFLALGFVKPHLPFCAPEKYWALYDDVELPTAQVQDLPEDAPHYASKPKHGELNQYKPIPRKPPLEEETERKLVQGYFASLSYMDAQVGRVLKELEELGLEENTIVVLWGDHGYHLGDHGIWTKHTNYEQANHIPLVFAGPGISASSSNALVESVDIYPTLAEMAGLPKPEVPQQIDGTSLVPIFNDPSATVRDHAYHCYPRPRNRLGRAIRTERYRLVEWKQFDESSESAEYELYDYVEDPLETRNLADKRPKVLEDLKQRLATHPTAKPPVNRAR